MQATTSADFAHRDDIFPFRIAIDRTSAILKVGPSLARMNDRIVAGRQLTDFFHIARAGFELRFEVIAEQLNKLVFLQMNGRDARLRGQFVRDRDNIIFLGSPWLESMEELQKHNLRIHDIAPHDATLENIFLRAAQNTQLQDLEEVLTELRSAADEKDRLSRAEESLAHDLNAAGDLLIRMTQFGEVLELRATRPEQLPIPVEAIVGRSVSELIPKCAANWQSIAYDLNHGAKVVPFSFTLGESGSCFESRIALTLNNDLLLLAQDVTEKQRLQNQLRHQALHDPLTDLPNRTLFERRVAEALSGKDEVAILFIDLDDFKSINDHQGHQAGDKLLVQVAHDLKQAVRASDVVARLGGDEFGVLLPSIRRIEDAELVANKVLASLQQVPEDGSQSNAARRWSVKASVGVATSTTSPTAETLFRNADIAMYRAKESVDDKVVVFQSNMYTDLCKQMSIRDELAVGLTRSEIVNHYQPIVNMHDKSIRGIEALARWEHPTRGLLSPYHFIEIAEASGAIVELGRQVLFRACQDAADFATVTGEEISVNVNISSIQVQREDFGELIRSALAESGLDPRWLTLEITESVLFADFEHASRVFREVKDTGVRVALDDFGAGHSSLKYLKQFPVDVLKLDRSFVAETDSSTMPLINAVIDMGRALDLKIVAEGIETQLQHDLLKSSGCHWGQGYLYSKPIAIEDLLREQMNYGILSAPVSGTEMVPAGS
jgi:diguanylate cyclase (GGDEF)-like protein